MTKVTVRAAIKHINDHGALLVFPIKTKLEVPSLWSCFHPRTKMIWEWTEDSGDQVPELWHLREELSRCRKVVYVKWFQGRATFFSLKVFTALLSGVISQPDFIRLLPQSSLRIYNTLKDDSPLPTKALRELSGFSGRENEAEFQRSLRTLWQMLLIVGYGEVEEGGFPSLALGCSQLIFEDLWDAAKAMGENEREGVLTTAFKTNSSFYKAYLRMMKTLLNANSRVGGVAAQPAKT